MSADKEVRYWLEGTDLLETPQPVQDMEPWTETRVVGQRRPRVDAYERVSGTATYPSDVVLPGMLYGAILRCPLPHARVRSVDISEATGMSGVHAVLSGLSEPDRALRPYRSLLREQLFDPVCRHEGEAVAAVAADTPYRARDALRAIRVDYEELPFVSDERDALERDAPRVHEGGNRVSEPQVYERGDVARGFEEADVVLEDEYRTECQLHTPLEPHGCVAEWEGDQLTLWESTQGVYPVRQQVAQALGMRQSRVRVLGEYMGGGFGSKLGAGKYTILAALLAKVTARPVKLFLTREETFLAVGNRPPANMRLRAGAKRDGSLTALEFVATATGGAYPAGGTSALDYLVRNLYLCPNVRTETADLYIHAGPARAMRAPGHPQCSWALEQMVDALAEAVGLDPVAFRLKNVPEVSQAGGGRPYTTTGLAECLGRGAEAFGWTEARARGEEGTADPTVRRGVGMAAGMWAAGGGGPPATVIIKLFSDGAVSLNMGASDIGTGTKTVMAMVAAEELWVDPDEIRIEHADTATTHFASASGGSKTVPTESPAVRAAAVLVKQQLLEMAARQLDVDAATLNLREGRVVSTSGPPREVAVSELTELRRRGFVEGIGFRGPNPRDKEVHPFVAQFCEVEVDLSTGEVEVLRFLGAHDSGRVLNRTTYDNQVFGGMTMGIGFGSTEKRVLDRGQTGLLLSRGWHDYRIPTALDVPAHMSTVPIDPGDTEANTTGAKGIGEPATIPTAAAVANAVHHATGVRITETPITPAKLVQALAGRERGV